MRNPFKWRKPFITTKDELSDLSETEKAMIKTHRESLLAISRGQQAAERELAIMFTGTKEMNDSPIQYIADFLGSWRDGNNTILRLNDQSLIFPPTLDDRGATITVHSENGDKQDIGKVIAVKPIDVLKELETVPGITIENLEAKIAVLKSKKDLIRGGNNYAKEEAIGMVERLENRRKWDEFKAFYSQFEYTTADKVQDLVNKYKLVLNPSDLFVSAFPDEAIAIMKEYKDQTVKLCGKQPCFYVIAEEKNFKEQYKKKDPILLVQSPFAALFQILGAWDKEMILLEEL